MSLVWTLVHIKRSFSRQTSSGHSWLCPQVTLAIWRLISSARIVQRHWRLSAFVSVWWHCIVHSSHMSKLHVWTVFMLRSQSWLSRSCILFTYSVDCTRIIAQSADEPDAAWFVTLDRLLLGYNAVPSVWCGHKWSGRQCNWYVWGVPAGASGGGRCNRKRRFET